MADILSKAQRSALMARVRSCGNRSTEQRMIRLMRAAGITGWRRSYALPGRPDFVFRAARLAVFVDGCFWHGCPKHGTRPKANATFWRKKLARNRDRDREVTRDLRRRGWKVMRIWEHALARKAEAATVGRLHRAMVQDEYKPPFQRLGSQTAALEKCMKAGMERRTHLQWREAMQIHHSRPSASSS
jgi:DNA mismatch endonuclease, patch repair protein